MKTQCFELTIEKKKKNWFIPGLIIFLLLYTSSVEAQYSTTIDTLNCTGGTTTFVIDLSSNADSSWISPPQVRAGSCCGTDNNCVQFSITLAPSATGINFSIPGGCGAAPSGSLFYQVDCGPLTSVGTPICLNGQGPHILTFCKPGNNDNCYSIQSIPSPATGGDVITADGCTDTLSVTGLEIDSIHWNSISPGNYGDFNGLLSNLAADDFGVNGISFNGYESVVVSPGFGSPSYIEYEVCGTVTGFCVTETWCDTVSVSIYPTLFAEILPAQPVVCSGGSAVTITANPIGGTAPYYFLWTTAVDPAIDGATAQSVDVTQPGEYVVQISDITGCPVAYDTVNVLEYTSDIFVDAGENVSICASPIPQIQLSGSSPVTGAALWSNFAGTFSTSSSDTSAIYTPSQSEIDNGFALLILESTDNFGCPGDQDSILISLTEFSATIDLLSKDISCNSVDDGMIDLTVSGSAGPFTFNWATGGLTEDVSGLSPGLYFVIITDSNGCSDSVVQVIEEPQPLQFDPSQVSSYNGYQISCYGMNDGWIDISVIGGTEPYSFNWTTLNGSGLNYAIEDQTGLTAGTYKIMITDANGCTIMDEFILEEPLPIIISSVNSIFPSGDNISCNGMDDGTIDLTVNGGVPGYTYNWSTSNGTGLSPLIEDQTGLTAGTYDAEVSDSNGCISSVSIDLNQPLELIAQISSPEYPSGTNISCFGLNDGSIELDVTGGSAPYSFLWSTADGSGLVIDQEDQTGLSSGTYTVLITDTNGCSIELEITLIEPGILNINTQLSEFPSGDNISCYGLTDGTIDLDISGGNPGYTFTWSSANGTGLVDGDEDQSGLSVGTYEILITDINGCTILDSFILIEPAPLLASGLMSGYPSGTNISCNGFDDGSIDLNVTGGSGSYSYSWTTTTGSGLNSTAEDQYGLTAGYYKVIIKDTNGCQYISTFLLEEPGPLEISASTSLYPSGDNISCNGMSDGSIDISVNGGNPGYIYSWTTSNGSSLINTQEDQSGLTAGIYTVEVTDINGCTTISTIELTEPEELTGIGNSFEYPSGSNISCAGLADGSIDLNIIGGSAAYTYEWNTLDGNGLSVSSEDQSVLSSGTYEVTATDINGCQFTLSFTLIEPDPLELINNTSIYPSGDNISCFGSSDGSIDLTINGGSPAYTYLWTSTGGNGLTATVEDQTGLSAGSYTVLITDINGCYIDSTIQLMEPEQIEMSGNTSAYPSGTNISCYDQNDGAISLEVSGGSPVYTYYWNTVDGSGINTGQQDQNELSAGTYTALATDVNGCSISESFTLIEPEEITISELLSVYPSGDNISCNGMDDGSVDITVNGGNGGFSYSWSTITGSGVLGNQEDQSGLTASTYEVTVTDINGCTTTEAYILTEPSELNISGAPSIYPSGTNISCYGFMDGSIDIEVDGGSPIYNYSWTTLNGSGLIYGQEDQSSLSAGEYTVSVTDINGCETIDTISLEQPLPIVIDSDLSVYPSGDNTSCHGSNDGSIDITTSGGNGSYTFNWSTNDGTGLSQYQEDQTGLTSGTYTITVTDMNGCSENYTTVLVEPSELEVTINVLSDYFGQAVSCEGEFDGVIEAVASGGSPSYEFTWNTNPIKTFSLLDHLTSGTYTVAVTDTNGCTQTASVILEANPNPVAVPGESVSACLGNNIVLNSNSESNELCEWDLGNGMVINDCGPVVLNLAAIGCQDASLTITNEFGCIDSIYLEDYICIHPNPVAGFNMSSDEVTFIDNEVTFTNTSTGATEYEWYFGDEDMSFESDPDHSYDVENAESSYTVYLYAYNEFGCYDSAMNVIHLRDELLLFVPNTFTPDGDQYNSVFLPVFGSAYDPVNYSLQIFDRWGELIFESRDIAYGWDGTYQGNLAQQGTYTWRIILETNENIIADSNMNQYTGHLNLIR